MFYYTHGSHTSGPFPGPFQDLGQIYKDLQLTYDS